jgi:hypothetical protein
MWKFCAKASNANANLLPGRSMRHLLYPLITSEYEKPEHMAGSVPAELLFPWNSVMGRAGQSQNEKSFPFRSLENRLVFGDLPGIAILDDDTDKADLLETYVDPGGLFEHWVAGQLWRILCYTKAGSLMYYRTSDGAEVDFIPRAEISLFQ